MKPSERLSDHLAFYAGAYLVGGLFIFVTILQSFVAQFAEFKDFNHAQLAEVTFIRWGFAAANTAISAGVVILAFLNQALARANVKKDADTAEKKGVSNPPFAPPAR